MELFIWRNVDLFKEQREWIDHDIVYCSVANQTNTKLIQASIFQIDLFGTKKLSFIV